MNANGMARLGKTFRFHRLQARLSQEELVKRTSMSQKKYSSIENGVIADPGFRDVVEIGRALGFTPNHMAEVAGLWSAETDSVPHHDLRWNLIVAFVRRADERERDHFLDLAYGAIRGIQQPA
jgi:transcriptional regulator with XRE-family HTH domain